MSTLENAASVLGLFNHYGVTQGHTGLSFTEVVSALSLPKSTVSRLLTTMEAQGFLERDPETRSFHIGRVLLSAASHYLSTPLVDSASTLMAQLSVESRCTCYISVLERREIMVMRMFQGRQFLQVVTPAGSRSPAAETSTGRAILARYSNDDVRELYKNAWPERGTGNSLPELESLIEKLELVRQQGWALACNESLQGISSMATAVTNKHRGETVGLGVTFPSLETSPYYARPVLDALMCVARQLRSNFGDRDFHN
ncbi:IclR family transcriptional regulator [[Pantoea] beijingensis]|uniref:IclR family transcriptional regulator n=1 Tax=[Pantoea] beijingensis TaxID=1324864 RepID=A0A443I924_9GAMM|nr:MULTISPECIES: IclR family transcriptional regulator [Erwiniaceae]RWR00618.1 IclR family transcriptional regulator [[Pantoea] beijingensis]